MTATVPNGDDRGQCQLSWPFAGPLPRCASSPLRRRPQASLLRMDLELPDVVFSPRSANGSLLFRHGYRSFFEGSMSLSS
jgi:hypothetical protein